METPQSEETVELTAMAQINGAKPARPAADRQCDTGLTKREEFAARILAGFAAGAGGRAEWGPRDAVKWADALLLELERTRIWY